MMVVSGREPVNNTGESDSDSDLWEYYRLEERLFIQSANTHLRGEDTISHLLQEDLDWQYTIDTAYEHCVTQLLYHALSDYESAVTPDWVLTELQAQCQRIAQQNLQYTHELVELVSAIRAQDIPVIPYRGPVLASIGYGDIGLRQFKDLDLLVYQDDIPVVKDLLLERGYEPRYWSDSTEELTETQERLYTKFCRDYPFQNDAGIEVELHWRVVSRDFPTDITMDRVWDRAEDVSIGGSQLAVLSPEDRLLMLLVHGSRHRWERLSWIVDVAQVLTTADIDMAAVWQRAKAQNCKRMVALGFVIVQDLFNSPAPSEVVQYINSDGKLAGLRSKRHDHLFAAPYSGQVEEHIDQAGLLDRTWQRVHFWLWWALSPDRPTIETYAFPNRLAFFYRVGRLHRLLELGVERVKTSTEGSSDSPQLD